MSPVWYALRDVELGAVVRGKYRVERLIGSGGMGSVFLATHVKLGQPVAIKTLNAESLAKPEMIERFAREARAAALLQSEHVVRVLDVDETEERVPFFVMELLTGEDLESVLKSGPLEARRVVDLVLQACEALAEAHARGIVHRDLKPANLFLARRPNGKELLKVLDFGISKHQAESPLALTTTQTVIGSPLYMSPEQLRASREVDARSDVWSLGVVLYQLLSGRVPFAGPSATAVAAAIAADSPAALDTEPALSAIVMRCLAKAPRERFHSVVDLARALEPFGSADLVRDVESAAARSAPLVAGAAQVSDRKTETLTPGSSTEAASAVGLPAARPATRSRVWLAAPLLLAPLAALVWWPRDTAKTARFASVQVAWVAPPLVVTTPPLEVAPPVVPDAGAPRAVPKPVRVRRDPLDVDIK